MPGEGTEKLFVLHKSPEKVLIQILNRMLLWIPLEVYLPLFISVVCFWICNDYTPMSGVFVFPSFVKSVIPEELLTFGDLLISLYFHCQIVQQLREQRTLFSVPLLCQNISMFLERYQQDIQGAVR